MNITWTSGSEFYTDIECDGEKYRFAVYEDVDGGFVLRTPADDLIRLNANCLSDALAVAKEEIMAWE